MKAPSAVLFDLGGTLLHEESFKLDVWAQELCRRAGSLQPQDPHRVAEMIRDLVGELRQPSKEGIVEVRIEACLRHLHARLSLDLDDATAALEMAFWQATCRMAVEPGVDRALKALQKRGVPMGVVSNSMFRADVLSWELNRHALAQHFRFVLSSADYGLRKPHPSIFLTALARMGVAAEQVWFVGDSFANDVAGAAGVGMQALWYNPGGERAPAALPHVEFRKWDQFRALCEEAWSPNG